MDINETHFCAAAAAGTLTDEQKKLLEGHKAALLNGAKWPVGAEVSVRFLEGDAALQKKVRAVAEEWAKIANLSFAFRSAAPTDIRIAFKPGAGSWSYIGTTCRQIRNRSRR